MFKNPNFPQKIILSLLIVLVPLLVVSYIFQDLTYQETKQIEGFISLTLIIGIGLLLYKLWGKKAAEHE